MQKATFLFSLSLLVCSFTMAQSKVGKMTVNELNTLNAKGAAMVKAIKPTKTALSTKDHQLLMQVAMGGQKQLAISQAVLAKVTNPQVKLLAQAEVEEQTTIAAKLSELATTKGATLPTETDSTAAPLLAQIGDLSGAELDSVYIAESGVKGHEELLATMTTVNENAKDPALKALATATLPVIRVHLKVSQDQLTTMKGTGNSSAKNLK